MSLTGQPRTEVVDEAFTRLVQETSQGASQSLDATLMRADGSASQLTGRMALELFNAQASSRHLDYEARALRARGEGFYTIGSSGHESNVVLGELLAPSDLCFLHYRSGALVIRRLGRTPGETPLFDVLLSMCASSEDPVSGGRHKVWGSQRLNIPPQTSTIASHLPKAVGAAFSLERGRHLGLDSGLSDDAIVCCSMGDASLNHSTTQGALNAALWASTQGLPVPLLFVCEDNGLGISVRTPDNWVQKSIAGRHGLSYLYADGSDLAQAWDAASEAVRLCRSARRPVFLHLKTCRLFGHAGSDIETSYQVHREIEAAEAQDPLLAAARTLVGQGFATATEVIDIYDGLRTRIQSLGREAASRPRLTSAAEVMAPLAPFTPEAVAQEARKDDPAARKATFGSALPEESTRPRHLAVQLNRVLREILAMYAETSIFGEDVARKGGVYHVTEGLHRDFGGGRVFNTLLDEQTILGIAIGAGHLGQIPIPEIQFLAYVHNAIDQLRGEASSLSFFSAGAWKNPMVVRIASFGYQRGFGGHFHNDASIAALRDIPGLVIACPTRGDDAVGMMRTAIALARVDGRVVLFLEPIALYMTKDLYEPGDGEWLTLYPPPGEVVDLGEPRFYEGTATAELLIVTFGNGVPLSLQAARSLSSAGLSVRVMDIRWIAPLNHQAIRAAARAAGRVLVVDEGRRTGGLSEAILTSLTEGGLGHLPTSRVVGEDCFIPLGDAWEHVLPSVESIHEAALELANTQTTGEDT